MSRLTTKMISLMFAAAFAIMSSVVMAKDEPPIAGYIDFDSTNLAAIIGYSWGSGELRMGGERYPIKGKVVNVGAQFTIAKESLTGNVYHAKTAEDVAGTYSVAEAGLAVAGGAGTAVLKNGKGTVLKVWSTTKGLDVSAAIGGLTIKLDK